MYNDIPEIDILTTEGIGYNVKYENEVRLTSDGVPYPIIEWCGKHIKSRWGWYFREGITDQHGIPLAMAIMTFEDEKEAFWFAMNKV